jgi:hypothetical protein
LGPWAELGSNILDPPNIEGKLGLDKEFQPGSCNLTRKPSSRVHMSSVGNKMYSRLAHMHIGVPGIENKLMFQRGPYPFKNNITHHNNLTTGLL